MNTNNQIPLRYIRKQNRSTLLLSLSIGAILSLGSSFSYATTKQPHLTSKPVKASSRTPNKAVALPAKGKLPPSKNTKAIAVKQAPKHENVQIAASGHAHKTELKPIKAAKLHKAHSILHAHAPKTPILAKTHTVLRAHKKHHATPIDEPLLAQEEAADTLLDPTQTNKRIHTLIDSKSTETLISDFSQSNQDVLGTLTSTHGVIETSLSSATEKAGLSDDLVLQLTQIFAWDVDFATNLSQGDQFTVIYANTNADNNSPDHQIIAAEFVNEGRILTALRYKNSTGQVNYYSPEGKPMRKTFLSAPLDYLKVSSGFSTNRRHPILNRIRAHKGIDYAARTGTPVKSAGDGEILFCGTKSGYGNVLIVKHGDHYETLYAHLSDFKDDLETGDTVKQGEVIGYVGQTGLATGPHLHYEFRVDGEHRNPEALNMAQLLPLHDEVLADFKDQTRNSLNQLNRTKAQSLLARNQYN